MTRTSLWGSGMLQSVMRRALLPSLVVVTLAACSSRGVPADRIVYRTSDDPSPALVVVDPLHVEAPAPPADDLTEAERRAWFAAHPDVRRHVPSPDKLGGRKLILAPDGSEILAPIRNRRDPALIKALGRAFRWKRHPDGHRHHSHWNVGIGASWWWGRPYWDRYDVWAWR